MVQMCHLKSIHQGPAHNCSCGTWWCGGVGKGSLQIKTHAVCHAYSNKILSLWLKTSMSPTNIHESAAGRWQADQTWLTGGGTGKPLPYSCRKSLMNSTKRQKIWNWKISSPVSYQTVANILVGKSRGQLLVAPDRKKCWAKVETTLSCGGVWWWK